MQQAHSPCAHKKEEEKKLCACDIENIYSKKN
jgi:hypothetical protein